MRRISKTKSRIRTAVLSAVAVATLGLGASAAWADGWEDKGHWLCTSSGYCVWIPDAGWTMPH